jgi:2-oxoglutarate/2-oxoacid ferredoxin oxidoreductase subunit beta
MNANTFEIPCEIPEARAIRSSRSCAWTACRTSGAPACGIGTTVNCFTRALLESKADLDKVAIVSGIGCTGRVAGYANLDSFHTTHGRAIPFATGLKLANPELQVVVYSGDGDLFAIGGNHFIHAARRNMDLKVICVNNLTYAMTGGQTAPTTPGDHQRHRALRTFRAGLQPGATGRGRGASYVARWTTFHVKQLAAPWARSSRRRASASSKCSRPAPRSTSAATRWATAGHHEVLQAGQQDSQRRAHQRGAALTKSGEIVVGKFVDRDRPDYSSFCRRR